MALKLDLALSGVLMVVCLLWRMGSYTRYVQNHTERCVSEFAFILLQKTFFKSSITVSSKFS